MIAAEALDEVRRQHRDVVGRSRSGGIVIGNTDSRKKRSSRNCRAATAALQIAVGGGDDAHVDLERTRPADAFEPLVLERAQDLGLQRQRQLADLVEEQRAAVRQLELAGLARSPRR